MATVTTQERTNILKLVAGMFNAAPGATYLNEFTNAFVDLNKDLGALANALGQTGAFQSLYPSFLSAEEFANKFLDTLGLKANTEAQDWVKAKVTAGESYASVIFQALVAIDASTSDDFKAAKDQLANKAAVAEYYSVEQNKSADDLAALQAVVAKVTNDAATVEAAKAGAAATAGQTFTLTTAAGETVVGTSGNDTFSAVAGNVKAGGYDSANSTLNLGDQIDGGAGKDTFNLTLGDAVVVTGTAASLAAGISVKNVEVVNIIHTNNAKTPAAVLTSATFAGVEELWQVDNAAGGGTFGGVTVAADVTAGFKSTGVAATAQALGGALAVNGTSAGQSSVKVALDGVAGAATSGSVLVFGATGAFQTITVTGSTVNATAANNQLGITDDTGTKTLNLGLTSNTIVNLTDADASITKIDLSASTGNVTVATGLGVAATDGIKTVIGGKGNDTLTVEMGTGATAHTGMSVNMGDGNDTLNLSVTTAAGDALGTVALGAGKDTLATGVLSNIAVAGASATAEEIVASLVTVTDFKTSEDVLDLSTGLALTQAQITSIKGQETLLDAVKAAEAIAAGTAGANQVVFSWGDDAYVFADNGTAGVGTGDGLIKLVGVDAAEFTNVQNGNLVL